MKINEERGQNKDISKIPKQDTGSRIQEAGYRKQDAGGRETGNGKTGDRKQEDRRQERRVKVATLNTAETLFGSEQS